jgi:hypothetical protein
MDNGEEIPGLNEDWQFAGAKIFEWISGFMMMLLAAQTLVLHPGKSMPFLVAVMIGTTFGLAQIRRAFPDEERGVRNLAMLSLGFAPPGIPRPAKLQPMWSGAPNKELAENTIFMQLNLDELFPITKGDEPEEGEQ